MKYGLIYADPPWPYNSRSPHKKTRFGGGVHGHYDVMTVDAIAALPVGRDYAAKDCALAMWVTGPHLASGIKVIEAWGFTYRTILFTWVKTTKDGERDWFGPGQWTASNVELVLFGRRGNVKRAATGVRQIVQEPHPRDDAGRIIHSRKPAEVRTRLERLFGDVPRAELFAREEVPGWKPIGNQLADGAQTLKPQATLFDWFGQPLEAHA